YIEKNDWLGIELDEFNMKHHNDNNNFTTKERPMAYLSQWRQLPNDNYSKESLEPIANGSNGKEEKRNVNVGCIDKVSSKLNIFGPELSVERRVPSANVQQDQLKILVLDNGRRW
ncbi:hypothetical protein RFI_34074, partial [Reticulomyxa filosa]